jgi:hypothetical protein
LARSLFSRRVWRPAVIRAGIPSITFHGLRHSFVAILIAAGCNVREVSEWAGHNSVAFRLTRYGGLFEDGSEAAVERLDTLGGSKDQTTYFRWTRGTRGESQSRAILTAGPDQHKHPKKHLAK